MDWQAGQLLSSIIFMTRAVVCILETVDGLCVHDFAGRLFQLLTTLWLKKNFLVSSQFLLMSSDSIMILS